jgi:hypothetical protein
VEQVHNARGELVWGEGVVRGKKMGCGVGHRLEEKVKKVAGDFLHRYQQVVSLQRWQQSSVGTRAHTCVDWWGKVAQ